jgi:hypothetical protein
MIVVHSAEIGTLYPCVVISSQAKQLENLHVVMPAKAQSHRRGVRPGDHYILLQMFTTGVYHVFL